MGIPKLLFFHQLITKSTFQSLKPCFNSPSIFTQIRRNTRLANSLDDSLHSIAVQFVSNSPKKSIIPLLDEYHTGNVVKHNELKKIIHTLRNKHLFDRALEVSEWMTNRSFGPPAPGELAVRLDLTGQVHGVDAAEKFFKELNDHSERMHVVLLNCYVKANLVDKSVSHFQMMKDRGLIRTALAYNEIMSLYMKNGQVDEVPKLLIEMKENRIKPDIISFNRCLKSLASKSDTASLEKLVNIMENEPRLMNWSTCCLIASSFIDVGCKDRAIYYLQRAKNGVRGNAVGVIHLITLYTKLGDLSQIMDLWRIHKRVCETQINADYMAMISSLTKIDAFEEAEMILQEWESSGNSFDFRVPNVLLLGYSRKGQVEKAEKLLGDIISKGKTPISNTWSIISLGHIKCGNMDKALESMMKALELVPEYQGWVPNQETLSSILKWLGDEGEIEQVDRFLEALSMSVPMNLEMYSTSLRANIRHGNEIGDILERMKAADIDVDEETSKLIKQSSLIPL